MAKIKSEDELEFNEIQKKYRNKRRGLEKQLKQLHYDYQEEKKAFIKKRKQISREKKEKIEFRRQMRIALPARRHDEINMIREKYRKMMGKTGDYDNESDN